MKFQDFSILVLLAALWGGSFIFIRVAAPVLGPLLLIDLRVLIAGIALLLYAASIRRLPDLMTNWRSYLILGAINAAIPFTLIATAALQLTASMTAILNATTPLFSAVVSAVWLKDSLTAKKVIGLVTGLIGVATVVGWNPIPLNRSVILAICASLLAALFYAIGGVYAKQAFAGTPPLALAIGQQLGAGLLLLPAGVANVPSAFPPLPVAASVGGLALFSTAVGYLLYFHLIRAVGPTNTLTVTFLVPTFAMFWSWLLLGERIGLGALIGLGVILLSITLVNEIRVRPLGYSMKTDTTRP